MDFPIDITTKEFVKGISEFRQVVLLILKNQITMFYQGMDVGSKVPQHGPESLLEYGIRETLKQIPGAELDSYSSEESGSSVKVFITVRYNGDIEEFEFSV